MTPRFEQIELAKKMVQKTKCITQAVCGFGKTITSIYAYTLIQKEVDYLYVVAPASIVPKYKETILALGISPDKCMITSWAKLPDKDFVYREMLRGKTFCMIIDECHRMKSTTTTRSGAAIRRAKESSYLFMQSATPTQNRPSDLYWMLKLCGAFKGTLYEFRFAFCGGYVNHTFGGKNFVAEGRPSNQEELTRLYNSVTVYGKGKRKLSIDFKYHIIPDSKQDLPAFEETSLFRREAGEIKKVAFVNAYREGHIKGKALIFAHHIDVIQYLSKELDCPYIKGGFSVAKKNRILKEFLDSDQEFLILSITASGEGIDIPNIKTCYFVELTYSPKKDEQAFMRMVRDDKDTRINVFYILLDKEHAKIIQEYKETYLKIGEYI